MSICKDQNAAEGFINRIIKLSQDKNINDRLFISQFLSLFKFNENVPEKQRHIILHNSISKLISENKLNLKNLKKLLNKEQNIYIKIDKKKRILLTSCSAKFLDNAPKIREDNVSIIFSTNWPKNFEKFNENVLKSYTINDLPKNYIYVKIFTDERCPYSAQTKALDTFDYIRGIWNLSYNFRRFRYQSGRPTPINPILLGPIHSMHLPNGKLETETFWWDPAYVKEEPVHNIKYNSGNPSIKLSEKQIRSNINKSGLKSKLKEYIVMYVRALDQTNVDLAYIKLWAVLEKLTLLGHDGSHEKVVKRTLTFIKSEYKETYNVVVTNLKNYRNTIAHTHYESTLNNKYLRDLQILVAELLFIWIDLPNFIRSEDDLLELFNTPEEISTIENRIKIYSYVQQKLRA